MHRINFKFIEIVEIFTDENESRLTALIFIYYQSFIIELVEI